VSETNDPKEVIRDSKGKFPKGVSGNPNGRPLGTKNRIAQMKLELEAAIRDHLNPKELKAIINSMVREAKQGNVQAAKLILDKVMSNATGSEETGETDNRITIRIENYTPQPEKVVAGVTIEQQE